MNNSYHHIHHSHSIHLYQEKSLIHIDEMIHTLHDLINKMLIKHHHHDEHRYQCKLHVGILVRVIILIIQCHLRNRNHLLMIFLHDVVLLQNLLLYLLIHSIINMLNLLTHLKIFDNNYIVH